MKLIITNPDGTTSLVEQPEGVQVFVVGGEQAALDVTDKEWAALHQQLKTGKLNFAKVKTDHGITEEPVVE